jgi:surface protein
MFNGKTKLLTVEYLKVTDKVTALSSNYYGMFDGCSNLTSVNMDGWDTSGLTSMEYAFYDCKKLASLNGINNLNIDNVKNMYYLFYNCSSLTQLDLSNWDTKNVTNMGYMFNGCTSLVQLDISNWDTSNTSSLAYFFNSCSSLNKVTATNVSTSTLSKLVTALPTRTSSSYGTIIAKNTTNEITSSANAKYWNVVESVEETDNNKLLKLGESTIDALYIGSQRIIQMYLNGQQLL